MAEQLRVLYCSCATDGKRCALCGLELARGQRAGALGLRIVCWPCVRQCVAVALQELDAIKADVR